MSELEHGLHQLEEELENIQSQLTALGKVVRKLIKQNTCVLCNGWIEGIFDSNNPWPLNETGRCCGRCNNTKVLPARIAQHLDHTAG